MRPDVRNWAGNVRFRADTLAEPRRVEELQALVSTTPLVRALGSGHSFSRVADTTGTLVTTRSLPFDVEVDAARGVAVVPGGATYARVTQALHERGWALHNLGSLPHISVAGAVSTGTHGSGDSNGSLSTAVVGVELVRGDGELVRLERGDPQFPGAVVALGCLGVVTRLWLRVEPAYEVRQVVHAGVPVAAVLDGIGPVLGAGYSVSLLTTFRDPAHLDAVWVKRRSQEGDGPAPALLGVAPSGRPMHPVPRMDPESTTEQLDVPGPWHHRLPHFRPQFTPSTGVELQSEYFLPREHAAAALGSLGRLAPRLAPPLQVCEVRTVAADDLWLSPCHDRDTVTVHFTWHPDRDAVDPVLAEVERVLAPYDPRPHWGKVFHPLPSDRLGELYPDLPRFRALVQAMDPQGRFRNETTDPLLG
jgi:alditol oxidase